MSPIGSDSLPSGASNNGIDPDFPGRTFFRQLCRSASGDTIILAPSSLHADNTYPDEIIPRQDCGVVNVHIIGDSTNPYNVIVPGISVRAASVNTPFGNFTVNGVRSTGELVLFQYVGAFNADAQGFHLRNSVIDGNTRNSDVDARFVKSRLGLGHNKANSRTQMIGLYKPTKIIMDSCMIEAAPLGASLYTDYAIMFDSGDYDEAPVTVEASDCTLFTFKPDGWNPDKGSIFQAIKNSVFEGCLFDFQDSTGVAANSDVNAGWLFRDRLYNNKFYRCTFRTETLRPGTGKGSICLTGSGSGKQGGGNVWRHCTFWSNMPIETPVNFAWQMQPGDSFYYNTVVCSTAVSGSGFYVNNIVGDVYVGHNTFANFGVGGAVLFNPTSVAQCSYWLGTLTFEGNIIYNPQTGTTSSDYAMRSRMPNQVTKVLYSDYNLYSHYGSTTGLRSFYGGYCGASDFRAPGPNGTLWSVFANDYGSVHGSPMFADSTFFGFDPSLTAASAALALLPDGSSAGPFDLDVVRPYEIVDLRVATTTAEQALLIWTATGDDSLTGTGTTYDIRYSTSLIDASNFASATAVTGPDPEVSGTVQSKVVTGLSASTQYYFAIKLTDEAGNPSAISNVPRALTQESGPEIADP